MNMGDFRGFDAAGAGTNTNQSLSFIDGINEHDIDQIKDLLETEQLQEGLALLVEKLPGFESFVQSMTGGGGPSRGSPTSTSTTTTVLGSRYFLIQSKLQLWHHIES